MKKTNLLAALLLCLTVSAQAQTTTGVPNAKVINGPYYTNITDVNGNSNTVVSVVPGISVQTPWWLNNLGSVAKSATGTPVNNQPKAVSNVNPEDNNTDNGGTVSIKPVAPPINVTSAQIEKELKNKKVEIPNAKAPVPNVGSRVESSQPVAQVQCRQGQTTSPVRVDNNIANFNQAPIREMEEAGKKQMNEAYAEFLRK